MGAFITIVYLRWCASLGSRRIIGATNAVLLCLFFSFVGLIIVLNSRKLLDEKADAALLKKYKQ